MSILWFALLIALLLVACFNKSRETRVYAAVLASVFMLGTGALSLNDYYNGPGTHPVAQG